MDLSTINAVAGVAQKLWAAKGAMDKASEDRRVKIAAFLMKVAAAIANISQALKLDFRSDVRQLSAELRTYGQLSGSILNGLLPSAEIANVSNVMLEAADTLGSVERRGEIEMTSQARFIEKLDEAAGSMRGLANILPLGGIHTPLPDDDEPRSMWARWQKGASRRLTETKRALGMNPIEAKTMGQSMPAAGGRLQQKRRRRKYIWIAVAVLFVLGLIGYYVDEEQKGSLRRYHGSVCFMPNGAAYPCP